MNRQKKNIYLLIITGVLAVFSVIIALTGNARFSTIDNRQLFSIPDASVIDRIDIMSTGKDIILTRSDAGWKLGTDYHAEPNIVGILLAVLRDMEIVRYVSKNTRDEITRDLQKDGFQVVVYAGKKEIKSFHVLGNSTKTTTYMMLSGGDAPAIVNIPGYESYVAGIFEITYNDWRDREVLSTNWRTLRRLAVSYAEYPEHSFEIGFDRDFLRVAGIERLDTARMMDYIEEFDPLQADRFLDAGLNARYDSLVNTPPSVTISIDDIQPRNTRTIHFFPVIGNDPMMVAWIRDENQMALFEAKRIEGLFAIKSEFRLEP